MKKITEKLKDKDTCSNINTDNEAITIRLKNTEDQITITTIYIPPASSINTSLLENIKNSADNIIITGDLRIDGV